MSRRDHTAAAREPQRDLPLQPLASHVVTPGPMSLLALPPLPTPLSTFIGRDELVTSLADRLRQPETRLVTLTGPGGVGKTRLALRVTDALRSAFADGVGFIPLATIREPALVLPIIAHRLGIREGDRRSLVERLGAHVARRRCLLVLDNVEQVTAAAPDLVALLMTCPNLTLLVTSRSPLHVGGEWVVPVPPMTLAAAGAGADIGDAEAVRLFVARAEAVNPSVNLTEATSGAIAAICERLDGLPLAIELAAAHSNLLSPPAILARLDHRLSLLTDGPHDQPARLRTMVNAIAWSYDLLGEPQQALFRRLSVFVGGFTLADAAGVCDTPDDGLLDGVKALIEHSLVQHVEEMVEEPRYRMLETVREFGLDQLDASGERDDAGYRHARHFLDLAERVDRDIYRSESPEQLHTLDGERANLHLALTWWIEHGEAEKALRLTAALWKYWRIRGQLTEGQDSLSRALAISGQAPATVRADVLWKLGYVQYLLGAYSAAQDHFEQSAALFARAGDRSGEVTALDSLGVLLRFQGDIARARALHLRVLGVRRELGEQLEAGITLGNLGMVALQAGDLVGARAYLEESLGVARRFRAEHDIGQRHTDLGTVALAEGRPALARRLAARALAIFERLGDKIGTSKALEVLGKAISDLGDRERGAGMLVESMQLRSTLGLHRNMARCAEWLASATASIDPVLAARLLAAAEADREASGMQRPGSDETTWDATFDVVRAALGVSRFETVWREGSRLRLVTVGRDAESALVRLAQARASSRGAPPSERPDPVGHVLTPREIEILQLVAAGHTNRMIASAISISPATVKRHLSNIFGKLEVRSRTAACAVAHRQGIIPPEP